MVLQGSCSASNHEHEKHMLAPRHGEELGYRLEGARVVSNCPKREAHFILSAHLNQKFLSKVSQTCNLSLS